MSKEIPILMSTPMVWAIIEGRKTMTRRIINPQPIDNTEIDGNFFDGRHRGYVKVDGHPNWREQFVYEFCSKKVGDVLWVRETFGFDYLDQKQILYKASPTVNSVGDDKWETEECKWKPSIFMPKEAARIWLEITDIKVEQVRNISRVDAAKEGVCFPKGSILPKWCQRNRFPEENFLSLWETINGKHQLDKWVWVIEFKVLGTHGRTKIEEGGYTYKIYHAENL